MLVRRKLRQYYGLLSALWTIRALRPTIVGMTALVALVGPIAVVLTWFLFNLSDRSPEFSALLRYLGLYGIFGYVGGKIGAWLGGHLAYAYFRAINKEILDGATEIEEAVVEAGAEA
jgi:hypothetical protein